MSRVRSRGNKSTEIAFEKIIRSHGIWGWRKHFRISIRSAGFKVRPDFVFCAARVAVFLDGCFWHGCPLHSQPPASNVDYWPAKLARNMGRDRLTTRLLRQNGWRVLRIWEHDLAQAKRAHVATRVRNAIARKDSSGNISAPSEQA